MNKLNGTWRKVLVFLVLVTLCWNGTAYAQGAENTGEESVEQELNSFVEYEGEAPDFGEIDQSVNGINDVMPGARENLLGMIRLYQSGTRLCCVYSTSYTTNAKRIGVKNLKLQYKGTLGLWRTIVTIDDKYRENASEFLASFSCDGVKGRVYRVTATHYIKGLTGKPNYTESKNNQTGNLTFQ